MYVSKYCLNPDKVTNLPSQNFKSILELITDAFFKHGEKDTLRSCIAALSFCSIESQAELQDYAQNKLKDLENELIVKLKLAMKEVAVCMFLLYGLLSLSSKI